MTMVGVILNEAKNLGRMRAHSWRRMGPHPAPQQLEPKAIQRILDKIRRYDFASYSDGDLRIALMRLKYLSRESGIDDCLPCAFAIVNEGIDRRLGVWKLFDDSIPRQNFQVYRDSAARIMESERQVDQGDLPDAGAEDLGADGGAIVAGMVRVVQEREARRLWDILLPAEFYHAVHRKDLADELRFRATDEQLLAGLHLFQGSVVQMNAGEGKTIAAAFPAVLHVVQGSAVHIITANDYLAARDADLLGPVYESLGIGVGSVLGYMEDEERRHAYRRGIVYSTMRELGFDFLRDNLKDTLSDRVQGKLKVAIIDEVDHALIDEACTPMIISGNPIGNNRAIARVKKLVWELIGLQGDVARRLAERASQPGTSSGDRLSILAQLLLAEPDNPTLRCYFGDNPRWLKQVRALAGQDYPSLTSELLYAIDPENRFVTLAEKGRDFLEQHLGPFYDGADLEESLDALAAGGNLPLAERRKKAGGITRQLARQYNLGNQVYQVLRAYLLLKRDVDYLVNEGSIVLVDQHTGRPKADCIYQHGLQTALEAKEGVTPNPECETLGQISVEGFIEGYQQICGMTGTASDSEDEFQQKYGLQVTALPPSQTLMRVDLGYRVYLNRRDKISAMVDEVIFRHRTGQPVLVGTRTVEQSEELSRYLSEVAVPHRLLNAVTTHEEAQIIRDAGKFAAVTVATNMAGRGTDILLEPGLNKSIARRYASMIHELLTQETGSVIVSCHSAPQADILSAELNRSNLFSTVLPDGGNRQEIRVTLRGGTGAKIPLSPPLIKGEPGGFRRLEFALGLYVIGTEINDTSRIDLQLDGRSARQGEFGLTQTFLSLEDRLINLEADGVLKLTRCLQVDPAGRTYFSGKEVARHVERVQQGAQREGEVQRSLIQDYAAVLDRQTHLFYRRRRQIIESDSIEEMCRNVAQERASRLVDQYFSSGVYELYGVQFDRLAEEVRLDYGVDCTILYGCDLNLLPGELGRLFIAKLDRLESRAGIRVFSDMAKLIFLQTCGELWRSHITELRDSISNQLLASPSHNSAVASYVRRSFEAWRGFWERVNAEFLSRVTTFPLNQIDAGPPAQFRISDEVEMLLAGRPMASTLADGTQRRD